MGSGVSEDHEHDQGVPKGERIDAKALIEKDLDNLRSERRRHFVPALLLMVLCLGGFIMIRGTRPDLLEQPPWQLLVQITLWGMCLVVFPAIGLGLLFPNRGTRIALAVGGVVLTIAATMGWPFQVVPNHGFQLGGCLKMLLIFGAGLLGLGLFSGAFVQRRRSSAVYWVAAGVTLAALNTITWHCPETGAEHVMPNHLGGAIGMMLLASVVGFIVHRRRKTFATGPGA